MVEPKNVASQPKLAKPLPFAKEEPALLLQAVGRAIGLLERDQQRWKPVRKKSRKLVKHGHAPGVSRSSLRTILAASDIDWAESGPWVHLIAKYIDPGKLQVTFDLQGAIENASRKSDPLEAAKIFELRSQWMQFRLGLILDLRGEIISALEQSNSDDGRSVKAAAFRDVKPLDEFDWSFNPSLPEKPVFDLATCRFIRDHRDILLIGPPGVGKSFVVQAVGYQAIKQGFLVLYRSIFDVVRNFMHHETLGDEDKLLARSATAILDRFLHHAEVLAFSGKSYRLRNQAAQPAAVVDSSKPANAPAS